MDRALRPIATEIATRMITDVDTDQIAEALSEALLALDIFALDGRSGPTASGYVSAGEAAMEILEACATPFIDNALRLAELGLEDPAMAACRGVLLGLYAVRHEEGDLLGHAPDFADETAVFVLERFKRALGRRADKADKLREIAAGMEDWAWTEAVICDRR